MTWTIERIVVGPIQCNCYIVSDPETSRGYLIDPGAESPELLRFLQNSRIEIEAVLITHAHIDHIGGVEMLYRQLPVPVFYHGGDQMLYQDVQMQAEAFGVTPGDLQAKQPKVGEGTLEHGKKFPVSSSRQIRVIHTPGHTAGSVCFYGEGDAPVVFTGDTLFLGSIGRTDLWGGSFEQIMTSIKTRLLVLPEETQVLPGHGPASSIKEERRTNPFLLQY